MYQGQYVDRETGLAYNRFRYYDNESGNYLSQDPIGLNGGLSLYSYVKNSNSIIDSFGLNDIEWVDPSKLNYSQAYVSENVNEYV
ncbi:RHS repeat-associated core domain-containing protein, partial [Rahnella sp. GSA61A]|uniref:RHS repeat-associated core domain-containing protein n=1 Tax=Rahnella sp. GSA61A TaxID=2862678 RepID=UPI00210416BC